MPIEFPCPHCGTILKAPEDRAGTRGKCKACGLMVTAPEAPSGEAPAPARPAKVGGDEKALLEAAAASDIEAITNLLAAGTDINCRDSNGWTPLYRAAFERKLEAVRLLVQRGADVTIADGHLWTPLHAAVLQGDLEVARLLLDAKAEVRAKTELGSDTIELCSTMTSPSVREEMLALLREHLPTG